MGDFFPKTLRNLTYSKLLAVYVMLEYIRTPANAHHQGILHVYRDIMYY